MASSAQVSAGGYAGPGHQNQAGFKPERNVFAEHSGRRIDRIGNSTVSGRISDLPLVRSPEATREKNADGQWRLKLRQATIISVEAFSTEDTGSQ